MKGDTLKALKIGDFVRFIDEKREGFITKIIDDNTIGVTDTDGFEVLTSKRNLTHVYGHYSNEETINKAKPTATDNPQHFIREGIYLAVAEEHKNAIVVHFFLVNESSYQLAFCLNTETDEGNKGEFMGVIQSKSQVSVYTANLGELGQWPRFNFQMLFFANNTQPYKEPLVVKKHFRAKDFSIAKTEVKSLNKWAWLIRLDKPEITIDAQKLKESFYAAKEDKPKVDKPADEVDLHIEKLRSDYQFIDNTEMLKIQLEAFQSALDAAIVHQMPSIIFIHGVGNGTLQYQIHKAVSKHPSVRTFMDAQKEKFGYGATKVILEV